MTNLVANGNFATGSFTDWTLGGNDSNASSPQIFVDTNGEGSSTYAAGLGSMGADGTLSQSIATTAGQTYTLSFWLQNEASGSNDFTAMWDGQPVLALTNASAFGYTEYTFTVTAFGSTSTLEFSAANGPSQWNLDNISLTAGSSTAAPAAPAISTGAANSNQSVTLTGTAPDGATVTVWDGATALGAATASSTGAWSLTTPDLSLGSYAFTATDTTSAGSSSASSPFDVTVTTLPAPPAISTGVENSNQSVTMTGSAPGGATVTVSTLTTSDGVTTALGTTTASSTGAWSFTTAALSAGIYDFTATDTTSAGTSSASNPLVVGVSSTNPDPVTYYVSSENGNNANAGTSESAPLATLQAAEDLVQPGDTVEVMNGTYTGNAPGGGDVLDITTSGTASAPITFEAAPGQTPVINSSGGWNAINIEASYIVVEGFTVVGDAANYTLAQALAGYSTGNANLDGNGIAVIGSSAGGTGAAIPNHITIENNTVHDEPGGGIDTQGADYVQILNNVVYDNAHWSAYGNSGISINVSANSDTNAGVHDIISGNLVFGNAQEVPTTGGSTITDGEGIILDTNPGFTGEILVENNTVYNSGSSGIESFLTDNAVITGNTVYGNNTENVQAANVAEIFINQSNNDTVTSNTTTAPSSTPPAAPVISTGAENSNVSVTLKGTAPDGSTVTVSDTGGTLGTATASSTGAWSFTTADLSAGSYAFTATDTTSAGTSAASSPFDVTVTSSSPPPAAPVISTGVANSNESVTLKGTAPDGSTVTVSDGGTSALGTATASSTGAWSFTTADLAAGFYAFTATDTTSAGTSAASSAFDVTVTSSSPPPSGSNLVANGNFATGNFTDWTLGGNDSNASSPQLFIDTNAEGGSTYAAGVGSMGADGTLSQTIATTTGQTYTLSFWLQNEGSGGNDFAAIWNGQTLLSLTNAAQSGYTEYTYTVTAAGSTTTLEFSAANGPSQWDLDNISLTANSTPPADPTVIQTDTSSFGSTSLTEVGNQYDLYNSSGIGPALKYEGADVVAGQFGAWTPIGAVQTASGYDVAWEIPGANDYIVWSTDSNGNYISNLTPVVSGTSSALESFAPIFGQDLNGGGVTGVPTVLQTDTSSFGATSLTEVWYNYFLDNSSGSGPELKYGGADVVAGQFGAWTPIGAVQTASGYDVAWEIPGANDYIVWSTGSNGNYISNLTPVVSGTSSALESFAPIFGQDLNGGGVTGVPTVIQTDTSSFGATSLTEVWYNYFLDNSSRSGPELKYGGADVVAGQFGAWTPIGAVQTASGYDVAWEIPGANDYIVWSTGSNGNYISNLTPVVSGTSTALESFESIFGQDLNGNGVIGLYAAPGTALQISAPLADPSGSATIGAGATLELAVADSGSVTFASSTGTLILEAPSTFSGEIFNFAGNGSLSGSDQIDLTNINFNSVKDSYANGVLTVTDGTNTDKLDFNGSYTLANFDFASDGSAGTIVYDPPVPTSNALVPTSSGQTVTACEPQTGGSATIGTGATLELGAACSEAVTFSGPSGTLILGNSSTSGVQSSNFTGTVSGFGAQDVIGLPGIAFDAQTTLGYLADSNQTGGTLSLTDGAQSAKIALLGNYMASSFAVASDNHGGTMVTEASQASNQLFLTNPQHT